MNLKNNTKNSFLSITSIDKKLFILGLIIGIIFFPFKVLPASYEGLFKFETNVFSRYLYQLSIVFTGIGAFAFYYKHKLESKLFEVIKNTILTLTPVLIYIEYNFLYPKFLNFKNGILLSYLITYILIFTWYFFQGYLTCSYLFFSDNLKKSWVAHLCGLIFGYFISYYYLNNIGIFFLIICSSLLFLSIFFKRNKLIFLISGILLFFSLDIENKLSKLAADISLDVDKMAIEKSKDINDFVFFDGSQKNIKLRWGIDGLTEIVTNKNGGHVVFINKSKNYTMSSNSKNVLDRNLIYNHFFSENNKKIIIGIGGARSLYVLNQEKMNNLYGLEINRPSFDFFREDVHSPTKELISKINYLNYDGRFFLDSQPNKSIDVLIYEGSYCQFQVMTNEFLKSNHLSNNEAIRNAVNKLKDDGVFVFEQNQAHLKKLYQFVNVMKTIDSLDFKSLIYRYDSSRFILIASRDFKKINDFKEFMKLNNIKQIRQFKNSEFINELDQCSESYDDNFPFMSLNCLKKDSDFSLRPIYISIGLFLITIASFIFLYMKSDKTFRLLGSLGFIIGLIQQMAFSMFQLKFEILFINDSFSTLVLILMTLISSIIGTLFIKPKIYTERKWVVSALLLMTISFGILPFLPLYKIQSLSLRTIIVFIFTFVSLGFLGTLYVFAIEHVKKENLHKFILLDCIGLFAGYLTNYFILRSFGAIAFSTCVIISIIFLIVLIIKKDKIFI